MNPRPERSSVPVAMLGLVFALAGTVPLSATIVPQDSKSAETAPAVDPAEEKVKAEKERRDLVRKQTRGQRELQMADLKLAKAKTQIDLAEKHQAQAVEKARKEIEVAERKLKNFR